MILIVGGLGYIGSNLVFELSKTIKDIRIIDNLSNSKMDIYHNLLKDNPNLRIDVIDATDYHKLLEIFNWNFIETIINVAHTKLNQQTSDHILNNYTNDIMIHFNLLKLCKLFNIKHYIYSSSVYIYDTHLIDKNYFIDEGHPIKITNIDPYLKIKIVSEEILKDISDHSCTKFLCLRHSEPLEFDHSLKDNYFKNTIIHKLFDSLLTNKILLPNEILSTNNDINIVINYIHIKDLIEAYILSLNYIKTMTLNIDIFNISTQNISTENISTENIYNITELIKIFNKTILEKIEIKKMEDIKKIPIICIDNTKAKNILKWKPFYTLEKIIQDYHQFYLNQILK